jgi:hypothetical protein
MTDRLVFEEIVGEDGKLVLQLPPDAPHGRIRITIEAVTPEEDSTLTPEQEAALDAEIEALLSDESLRGLGQTAEEIARAPEIGIWKDRADMTDSVAYIADLRRKNAEERSRRE